MSKLSIFPIENQALWDFYKKCEAQTWRAQGMDTSNDNWDSLTENQKNHLGLNLAFFANSDKVVADNIALNFLSEPDEVVPAEAKFFYSFQIYNENVHNETYALLIESYFKNLDLKNRMLAAVENIPSVAKKVEWATKWLTKGIFEEKLIAFIAVESIMFSSTFSTIFGYKSMQKPLAGLYWANEEISRDESSHYEFGQYFYNNYVKNKLPRDKVKEIILGACDTEIQFVTDCFAFKPEGFKEENMIQYVQYVTDTVLMSLNIESHFNVQPNIVNKWMSGIATPTRVNFFEKRSSDYSKLKDSNFGISTDF